MKNYFIGNVVSKENIIDKEKSTYGLDVIYTSFTKLIFIIFTSIIFKCFYITITCVLLIFFIRSFSYGLHMDTSIKCYMFSFIIFVLFPKFFVYINISNLQSLMLFLLSIISFFIYSPSDTYKRPLINMKKRKALKYMSLIVLVCYIVFYLCLKDTYFSKIILYSVIIQSILINPITYKLFNLSYNNFKEVMK
jgi:accessory gene regulator B